MFKLFRAELKKIFLKPSIFVVTGLIILMLAISTFLYNPSTKTEYRINYSSSYTMVKEFYDEFTTGNSPTTKKGIDILVSGDNNSAETYVMRYQANVDTIAELKQMWSNAQALFNTTPNYDYASLYRRWSSETDPTTKETLKSELEAKRTELYNAINNFQNKYLEYSNRETITFLVTTKLDYKIVYDHMATIKHIFDDWSVGVQDRYGYILNEMNSRNLFKEVSDDLNGLVPFSPDKSIIEKMSITKLDEDGNVVENESSPIVIAKARLAKIFEQIKAVYDKSPVSTNKIDIDEIMRYINNYYLTANYARTVVVDSIKTDGLQKYSALNITQFKQFEKSNLYEMKENVAKANYLFDTETYDYQYAEPFSIIQPSNTKINGFDYSYYALRLCTFFITIYIVVLAAGTIAGEQSAGTLKLLAIRPYSRNKLLSAKICATLAIGAILIFVSSIASLVVGGVTYGLNFTNILVVFNASTAFAISPILVYLIAMLTMFVEVMFYAMISIFISTLLKSNVAAVSISTLIFFVSLVLNVVATNVPVVGLVPFVNVNFFKYFGSSFLAYTNSNNLIQNILTPTVFSGSTFWTSLILYSITFVAVTIATHVIFKKRDIK